MFWINHGQLRPGPTTRGRDAAIPCDGVVLIQFEDSGGCVPVDGTSCLEGGQQIVHW
jgi:hypothetical protein